MKRMWDKGVMVRFTQDTMAVTPPLIAERKHIDEMFDKTREALKEIN
jgi:beta-alanine--pyruvate transaminase